MQNLLSSPNYRRAPITEAFIQLNVSTDVEEKALEKIQRRLKSVYPNAQPLQNVQISLNNTGSQFNVSQNPKGFRLSNNDQTDILFLNSRGVTAARLAPYPNWEHLRENAKIAWEEWRSATPGYPIDRLGVRFVNRIDVPVGEEPTFQMNEYVNFFPSSAPISAGPLLAYLLQISIPTVDPNWIATITTTSLGTTQVPKHHSLMLDIDVFCSQNIPMRDEQLWPMFDNARLIKNDIFERCVTDASRKLFQS